MFNNNVTLKKAKWTRPYLRRAPRGLHCVVLATFPQGMSISARAESIFVLLTSSRTKNKFCSCVGRGGKKSESALAGLFVFVWRPLRAHETFLLPRQFEKQQGPTVASRALLA